LASREARRAETISLSKRTGRRFAPPTKKSGKFLKVKLWSIFMTLLELILSEIPEKASARPAERGGQENSSARGQKIPPPKPLHFLPTRWKKFFAKNL